MGFGTCQGRIHCSRLTPFSTQRAALTLMGPELTDCYRKNTSTKKEARILRHYVVADWGVSDGRLDAAWMRGRKGGHVPRGRSTTFDIWQVACRSDQVMYIVFPYHCTIVLRTPYTACFTSALTQEPQHQEQRSRASQQPQHGPPPSWSSWSSYQSAPQRVHP